MSVLVRFSMGIPVMVRVLNTRVLYAYSKETTKYWKSTPPHVTPTPAANQPQEPRKTGSSTATGNC